MLAGDGLPEGSTDLVTLCGCQLHVLHFSSVRWGCLDVHTGRSGGEPVGEKLVSIVVLRAKQANAGHAYCFRGAGPAGGDTYDLAHVCGVWWVIGMGRVYGMRMPTCRGDEEVLAEVRWRRRSAVVFVGGVCEGEGSCVLTRQPTAAAESTSGVGRPASERSRLTALARTCSLLVRFHFAVQGRKPARLGRNEKSQ